MTRLDTFLLLLLAGIGWGCGFALVGFAVYRGVPGNASLSAIFAGFGFSAGVLIAAIRLALERENIESRPPWKPMHLQPVFKDCRVRGGAVSEELFERGLCLPSGTALRDADLERIAGAENGDPAFASFRPCIHVDTDVASGHEVEGVARISLAKHVGAPGQRHRHQARGELCQSDAVQTREQLDSSEQIGVLGAR